VRYPERIVPEDASPGILALHLKRYEFALAWSGDADVLDAGCGTGYGSAFLAANARRVTGVDSSAEAIDHARERYAAANVDFVQADVLALPFDAASFDLVCAFETIEHVADQDGLLREAARVLRAAGTLLVSTPRAPRTTREPANPFHQIELSRDDFEELLTRRFGSVELFGQRRLQTRRHRLMQRLDVFELRRRLPAPRVAARLLGTPPMATVGLDGIVIEREGIDSASELLAVCRQPRTG
jgi:SAM-dependent methyltransferase